MMRVIQCKNKHYYDSEKYKECPHCRDGLNSYQNTLELQKEAAILATEYINSRRTSISPETIQVSSKVDEAYFVTGWLVCISGPDIGHSFNLFQGYNTAGRSQNNKICLEKDNMIDENVHFSIIYDDRKNRFFLLPESSRYSVYLNGQQQTEAVQIYTENVIQVGKTELEFVAFCRENRKWKRTDFRNRPE